MRPSAQPRCCSTRCGARSWFRTQRLPMSFNALKQKRWQIAALIFLLSYVAAHFTFSRVSRAMVERDCGISDAFLYLPVPPNIVIEHEGPLLYVHGTLRCFFYPVWKLDHSVFGGPWPMCSLPMMDLSE